MQREYSKKIVTAHTQNLNIFSQK